MLTWTVAHETPDLVYYQVIIGGMSGPFRTGGPLTLRLGGRYIFTFKKVTQRGYGSRLIWRINHLLSK